VLGPQEVAAFVVGRYPIFYINISKPIPDKKITTYRSDLPTTTYVMTPTCPSCPTHVERDNCISEQATCLHKLKILFVQPHKIIGVTFSTSIGFGMIESNTLKRKRSYRNRDI
jgi:hypothetical protein